MRNSIKIVTASLLIGAVVTAPAQARGIFSRKLTIAEPLFGADKQRCFDDPAFMLSIVSKTAFSSLPIPCKTLADDLRNFAVADPDGTLSAVPNQTPLQFAVVRPDELAQRRRNEIVDALIAVSNQKCSTYSSYLKTFDGGANSALGILSLVTGGLGSFVGGAATAKALSGTSAIINGSRSTLNEVWFSNQTIHVLAAAFEKARARARHDITNRQVCPIKYYTTMRGVEDVLQYHASCSLLAGLAETSLAVARADEPGLDAMRRQLADLDAIRIQASALLPRSFGATSSATTVKLQELFEARAEARTLQGAADTKADKLEAEKDAVRSAHEADDPAKSKSEIDALIPADKKVKAAEASANKALQAVHKKQEQVEALDTELRQQLKTEEDKATAERTARATLTASVKEFAICPFNGERGPTEEADAKARARDAKTSK